MTENFGCGIIIKQFANGQNQQDCILRVYSAVCLIDSFGTVQTDNTGKLKQEHDFLKFSIKMYVVGAL